MTSKVPVIPLRYLPSTEFTSVFKVARNLTHNQGLTVQELVELSDLSEGTVQNIGSDINMFGIATRDGGTYMLSREIAERDELACLRVIREKFKKHAFTLALRDRASSSMISHHDAISTLQSLYLNSSYADKTWHSYTVRMCRWLELCGFLVVSNNGWIYRDQGDVISERIKTARSRRKGNLFTAPTSPALTVEALSWLINQKQTTKKGIKPKGYRNAILILTRFELATQDHDYYPIQ